LIVIGCVLFAVIVVVVGVEVAVKKGRLPKLAAKRAAAKQKRMEKKNKKKGISSEEVYVEQSSNDDLSIEEQVQTVDNVQNDNQSDSDSFDENNE
ncbi:MAG: hypothetical protein IJ226_02040, partial [Clostridia bacterium]|nr:hypothetical protein [Clostridia bacterium]